MEEKKVKFIELVKMNLETRTDANQFIEWELLHKLNFIVPIINTGNTDGIQIAINNGVIADGRQIFLTLKQYINDGISSEPIGNFIPYGMLSKEAKMFVDNIEFKVMLDSI
ncbi:hypothetical protein JOD82_001847 [Paenibacillus sp. 1182]|uniref:hypothetical protein n=1 Tax=Paenibacillus sp. 1182 TaxID=2806565 RepID=UPI001AE30024|nr:hypothetical protein [Paenibacillus sp. 1182]MBP1308827.1 hypothetical protein [Paenibacillus sp. 1182]